jgi:hypothetical protein
VLRAAAVLTIAIGLAHSWLGERYLIRPLLRRPDLPELFGDDSFTRCTIRFGWHLTTAAWFGLAALMWFLHDPVPGLPVGTGVPVLIAATFITSAILGLALTRGRHLSWIVFVAIAVLCALAVE